MSRWRLGWCLQNLGVDTTLSLKQPGTTENKTGRDGPGCDEGETVTRCDTQQKIYILTALRKLGESLTPEDETFLTENTTATLRLSLKKWLQNKGFNKKKNLKKAFS